jgi:hypothetical protein
VIIAAGIVIFLSARRPRKNPTIDS